MGAESWCPVNSTLTHSLISSMDTLKRSERRSASIALRICSSELGVKGGNISATPLPHTRSPVGHHELRPTHLQLAPWLLPLVLLYQKAGIVHVLDPCRLSVGVGYRL